jgi:multiple sugar transport system substrate-binding protein
MTYQETTRQTTRAIAYRSAAMSAARRSHASRVSWTEIRPINYVDDSGRDVGDGAGVDSLRVRAAPSAAGLCERERSDEAASTGRRRRRGTMRNARWLLYVIVTTLVGLGLATTPFGAAAQPVTLQILSAEGDPNSVAAMKWVIAEFKKIRSNVDVEYQTVSWTELGKRIVASTAAGSPPDIVHLDDFGLSVLADQGILEPADDVVRAIGIDDYNPTALRAVTFKGTVWGVPFSNGFDLFWYRKDLYDKFGLKPPKTWDELLHNVKTLHGNLPGVGQMYGIAMALNTSNHTNDTIQNFMWSNGATILDKDGKLALNSPEAIQAYNFQKELFKYAPPGVAQYGHLEVLNAFATGKVAHSNYAARMILHVMRNNPQLADSVGAMGVKPLGPSTKARPVTILFTKAWGFPKGTKHLALAKEFVQFLQTGEREVRWLHSVPIHFWPPRKSTAAATAYGQNPIVQGPLGREAARASADEALPNAQPQLSEAGVVNANTFKILQAHVLPKMMQKIVLGNVPTGQAVAEAMREAQEILSR